jgi:uncharacterized 2Fe-2S/4Fe-4S cluster protein (DUF4445 family)
MVRVPAGVMLFDAASWNGIAIDSTCGGHGTCGKCKVKVLDENIPFGALDTRALSADEIAGGWRLSCGLSVATNLRVEVPAPVSRPRAATVGVRRKVLLRPAVQKRYVELSQPTLADQTTDLERLLSSLDDLELRPDLEVLRRIGRVLRAGAYKATAVVADDMLIDIEPGDTTERAYAIAFDLGTTTVVATLLDLSTGASVAVCSALNKQQSFGADVISRISAVMEDHDALGRLRGLAHETLAELAEDVCRAAGVGLAEVYEVALAGNATMTHLVLGIDPSPLGVSPFVMSTKLFPEILATEIGLSVHERARAVVFPAVGAYVGGDIVAGLIACEMDRDPRIRLFLDLGTNCELVLGNRDRLVATAAPAGPAFEGASIRCGMRAAPGAIEAVKMTPDDLEIGVIGGVEAIGLCGSGLVDAVAGLVGLKLLDSSGKFVPDEQALEIAPGIGSRLAVLERERVFVLHWRGEPGDIANSVYLSQRDVRELQFAKAAIATGWHVLLEETGIDAGDLQEVVLAGSFGSYLSPRSAICLGLVPRLPLSRVVSVGNVAGEGAKIALLNIRERQGAMALLAEVEYVELSDRADFNDRFVDQLPFPR